MIHYYGLIDNITQKWFIDGNGRIVYYPAHVIAKEHADQLNSKHKGDGLVHYIAAEFNLNQEIENQKDLDPEINEIVNRRFWDLVS